MEPLIDAAAGNWYFSLGITFAILVIITRTVASIASNAARERSRREIAAYIAEGSMTPEEGERLLNAGKRGSCC